MPGYLIHDWRSFLFMIMLLQFGAAHSRILPGEPAMDMDWFICRFMPFQISFLCFCSSAKVVFHFLIVILIIPHLAHFWYASPVRLCMLSNWKKIALCIFFYWTSKKRHYTEFVHEHDDSSKLSFLLHLSGRWAFTVDNPKLQFQNRCSTLFLIVDAYDKFQSRKLQSLLIGLFTENIPKNIITAQRSYTMIHLKFYVFIVATKWLFLRWSDYEGMENTKRSIMFCVRAIR